MKKPCHRFTVADTKKITPNMLSITLQTDEPLDFPPDSAGRHVKILFDKNGSPEVGNLLAQGEIRRRTYSIRHFDANKRQIELNIVCHPLSGSQGSIAASWAMSAQDGDPIYIAGPGKQSPLNLEADWYFMVADMTALPALAARLHNLPADARGYIVIKLLSEQDKQPLSVPQNMELHWIVDTPIAQQVRSLEWYDGSACVWCACEFNSMRTLRQYFRNEKQVAADSIYISSYWKEGVSEEGHKQIKKADDADNPLSQIP